MIVAGMDGCRGRWLCVWGKPDRPEAIQAALLSSPEELLALAPRPEVVAADIPIGLPDAGPRAADRAARRRLGRPRSSSVFPAPLRAMLNARDYRDACGIGRARAGRALSRQAWNILPLVQAMDAFLTAASPRATWLREAHPELSFQACNGGVAMAHNKRTAAGQGERSRLVEAAFPGALAAARTALDGQRYNRDDLLDALAVFWTATRIAKGHADRLPEPPEHDARGLAMEILV